jgi:hypothetical protein
MRSAREVELTTSANSTVTSLSISAAGAAVASAPQAGQKRAFSGSAEPQAGHVAT